jgi:hypothetical protein
MAALVPRLMLRVHTRTMLRECSIDGRPGGALTHKYDRGVQTYGSEIQTTPHPHTECPTERGNARASGICVVKVVQLSAVLCFKLPRRLHPL